MDPALLNVSSWAGRYLHLLSHKKKLMFDVLYHFFWKGSKFFWLVLK